MSTLRVLSGPTIAGTAALALTLAVVASAHSEVQIVLHAIDHPDRVHCFIPEEMGYQDPATETRTSVPADSEIDVFVYLVGYDEVSAAAFKLVWPADWEYFGWVGDCLPPAQITVADLEANSIDVGTAFNSRTGGEMLPLGFASFRTTGTGEVQVVGSWQCIEDQYACYVSGAEAFPILFPALGRVEVGGPGYNPAAVSPVAQATWGAIKASFSD
jgi:hypothetical protein